MITEADSRHIAGRYNETLNSPGTILKKELFKVTELALRTRFTLVKPHCILVFSRRSLVVVVDERTVLNVEDARYRAFPRSSG